jgi:hypothetical protein
MKPAATFAKISHDKPVSLVPRRVLVGLRRGCVLAAILISPATIVGGAAATVRTLWADGILLACAVVAVVAASHVVPERKYSVVAAAVVGLLSAILVLIWAPMAVLEVRGVEMTGTVTGVHVLRGKHSLYQYALRDPTGSPMPGKLNEYSNTYAMGDEVEVVVDRRQKLDPVDASDLQDESGLGIAAVVGLLLTVALSIAAGCGVQLPSRSGYRPRH